MRPSALLCVASYSALKMEALCVRNVEFGKVKKWSLWTWFRGLQTTFLCSVRCWPWNRTFRFWASFHILCSTEQIVMTFSLLSYLFTYYFLRTYLLVTYLLTTYLLPNYLLLNYLLLTYDLLTYFLLTYCLHTHYLLITYLLPYVLLT